jgi:hypothetical protein
MLVWIVLEAENILMIPSSDFQSYCPVDALVPTQMSSSLLRKLAVGKGGIILLDPGKLAPKTAEALEDWREGFT